MFLLWKISIHHDPKKFVFRLFTFYLQFAAKSYNFLRYKYIKFSQLEKYLQRKVHKVLTLYNITVHLHIPEKTRTHSLCYPVLTIFPLMQRDHKRDLIFTMVTLISILIIKSNPNFKAIIQVWKRRNFCFRKSRYVFWKSK